MAALLEKASSRSRSIAKYLLETGLERGTVREGVLWRDVIEEYPYNDYISNNHIFKLLVKRGIYKPEEYGEFFVTSFKKTPERMTEMAAAFSLVLPNVDEVIKTVTEAEGVPVVAHLGEAPFGKIEYVEELYSLGTRGFEIWHPGNSAEARKYLENFCNANGLYKTGGTDHSATLGGCAATLPVHDLPDDCGGMSETDFNNLYARKFG